MREKETISLRPKFRLTPKEHKSLIRTAKIMGVSMSGYIKMQVKLALNSEK